MTQAAHDPYHALRFAEFRRYLVGTCAMSMAMLMQSVVMGWQVYEIGAFESGVAARFLGLVPSVVFGGLMTLGIVGATAWKAPELRQLKHLLTEY